MMTDKEFHSIFGKLYWYALVYRGASPGCMPNGVIDSNLSFGIKGYGAVGYKEPLSQKQIDDYELSPLGLTTWGKLKLLCK